MVMSDDATFRSPAALQLVERPSGLYTVGVVAWLLLLRTPECPQGRQVQHTCTSALRPAEHSTGALGIPRSTGEAPLGCVMQNTAQLLMSPRHSGRAHLHLCGVLCRTQHSCLCVPKVDR